MLVTRTERHVIKAVNPFFNMLMDYCHRSKNLYNHANFLIRQTFFNNNEYLNYTKLDKLLKADTEYADYAAMPTAQSAQQTLRLLDKNYKSFFKATKDYSKHKEKYLGKPKLPKYLKKNGKYILVLTNQNCKIKDGYICFLKTFKDFKIKPEFLENTNYKSFQQVRIVPRKNMLIIELVYKINICDKKADNNRYIGIDIGVNNLVTVANNIDEMAFIINGKPLKSVNQYYNKKISHYREICKRMNNSDYSVKMDKLTEKRNAKINDYMHKTSRKIINYCIDKQINTIIIGKNKNWKQKSDIGKKNNQNFIQIPFARLIEMIQYKAKEYGITVIITEESYTSGTSFIDDEKPVKESYNKARRIKRGLFRSNSGMLINSDLNAAYQIIKKVASIKWSRGCALHPAVVGVA